MARKSKLMSLADEIFIETGIRVENDDPDKIIDKLVFFMMDREHKLNKVKALYEKIDATRYYTIEA
jgi:hypothetical protein